MGQIQIFFGGVCTFFADFSADINSNASPPVQRMVLVNANVTDITLGGDKQVSVTPHSALLTMPPSFRTNAPFVLPPNIPGTDDYDLNFGGNYTISVANATPVTPAWTNLAGCLPHLQASLPPGVFLGAPSDWVVAGGGAACYVDFTYGMIQGFAQLGASGQLMGISMATVATTGNPQLLILNQNLMNNPTILTFDTAEVAIAITNKPGNPGADDPNDFLFNYLTCATPPEPSQIRIPTVVCCGPPPANVPGKIQHFDAGPGCSNTTFP